MLKELPTFSIMNFFPPEKKNYIKNKNKKPNGEQNSVMFEFFVSYRAVSETIYSGELSEKRKLRPLYCEYLI